MDRSDVKEALTGAGAERRKEARRFAPHINRCVELAIDSGERCRQPARWGLRCNYHARWVPPLVGVLPKVTKTRGSGECACCVRRIFPGHKEPRKRRSDRK